MNNLIGKILTISILIFLNIKFLLAQNYGFWIETDSLNTPRNGHSSSLLPNGNILVSGGNGDGYRLKTCEIFDIQTGKWRVTDSMNIGRTDHQSILLKTGNILVIGSNKTKSCELYDPVNEEWQYTDSLNVRRRFGYTATLLQNGSVLITGGYDVPDDIPPGHELNDCELYNSESDEWNVIDTLNVRRDFHSATLLLNGKVLICGGSNSNGALDLCELFNPETNTWAIADSMNIKRSAHSATLLSDGRVLISGGTNYSDSSSPWLNDCEIYNPVTNEWNLAGNLVSPRELHYGILLQNGLILFTGGAIGSDTWELFNPVTLYTIYWDYYIENKQMPTSHILSNGRVINIGGISWKGMAIFPTKNCEIYVPAIDQVNFDSKNSNQSYYLYQNNPNPFNSQTSIKYYIPFKSFVTLCIYDITGRVVRVLINNVQSPGFKEIDLNLKLNSSGVYIYKLYTKSISLSKKMILIK